jgi:hypothetical protein
MQLQIQKQTLTKTMAKRTNKTKSSKKRRFIWIHVVWYFFYIISIILYFRLVF